MQLFHLRIVCNSGDTRVAFAHHRATTEEKCARAKSRQTPLASWPGVAVEELRESVEERRACDTAARRMRVPERAGGARAGALRQHRRKRRDSQRRGAARRDRHDHQQGNQSHRSGVTNETGTYSFTNVQAGTYDVKVSLQGFKEYVRTDVPVTVNTVSRVDAAARSRRSSPRR